MMRRPADNEPGLYGERPGLPADAAVEHSDDLSVLDDLDDARAQRLLAISRAAAMLVSAALLVVLGHQAAIATWTALGLRDSSVGRPPAGAAPAAVPASAAPGDRDALVRSIISAGLFGTLADDGPAPADLPPDTRLDLTLKGIIFTEVAGDARAIIASPDGSQSAHAIGQQVSAGARLVEIRSSLVILERDGQREVLRLEQPDQGRRGAAAGRGAPDRRIDQRGDYQLARTLGGFQARLKTNPAAAMALLRLQPERDGERMLGVRVFPGPEPGLLERTGLQPGDLVTHINGQPLDSPAAGLEALRALTAARDITLQVRRGQRQLAYSFSVAQ